MNEETRLAALRERGLAKKAIARQLGLDVKTGLGPAIGYPVEESGFSWTGESRLTAADLLAAETAGDERAADEDARRFPRELLADGPLPARRVLD